MELLYWVDRTLTKLIQALFQSVSRKFRVSTKTQSIIGLLIGTFLALFLLLNLIKTQYKVDWSYIVWYESIYIGSVIAHRLVKHLLVFLHRFFDFDGAVSRDKLYLKWIRGMELRSNKLLIFCLFQVF